MKLSSEISRAIRGNEAKDLFGGSLFFQSLPFHCSQFKMNAVFQQNQSFQEYRE